MSQLWEHVSRKLEAVWACFLMCKMRQLGHMIPESLPALTVLYVQANAKWEEAVRPGRPATHLPSKPPLLQSHPLPWRLVEGRSLDTGESYALERQGPFSPKAHHRPGFRLSRQGG